MIELLANMPAGVTGVRVSGRLGSKRIAVLSDKPWVGHTLHAMSWMIPGDLAVFTLDELDKAKEWAAS